MPGGGRHLRRRAGEPALESLSKEECLGLLKCAKYGRVGVVTSDGRPEIFPVNYGVPQ
jgi:nitroimidazol reductase NimA-like FMN-containing flavoprotein (pyridoxamine 5'-phosphate oxidase superfamily)